MPFDPVELGLFSQKVSAVCDEMGAQLRRAAFSPNIRDRLDYSCAIFDSTGLLIAQAAHIPVHLGSMAYAMQSIVTRFDWTPDMQVIWNDPYLGGTHLPDVTLVAPVFAEQKLAGFVANRAHYADIGSVAPGSMPLTTSLDEEGLLLKPQLLVKNGRVDHQLLDFILSHTRGPSDARGDINAQIGANQRGVTRLKSLIGQLGRSRFDLSADALNDYAEKLSRASLSKIPPGHYQAEDLMDDDGQGASDISIRAAVTVENRGVEVNFNGTADQVDGNINCPFAVTVASVWYVLRCLMPEQTPGCAGSFRPVKITAPQCNLVNACYPAPVAAGNVETSSRIVDVVMRALSQALPERIPSLSQGTMNNITFGENGKERSWGYYETIGGGAGAGMGYDGMSGIQSHMTNTQNTPVEVLEMRYPVRARRYALRSHSGGGGRWGGGDGIIREFEFLCPLHCTLLTERRMHAPSGFYGGHDARIGINWLNQRRLPGKCSIEVGAGDRVTVETPGGGGWGSNK